MSIRNFPKHKFLLLLSRVTPHRQFYRIFSRRFLTILVYHNPRPDIFEKHLVYYQDIFNFVSIGDYWKAKSTKYWDGLPPNPLVVTFDDGYAENYELLPLFRKYSCRPIIYLCSGLIDTNRHFWFKEIPIKAESNTLKLLSQGERLSLLKEKYNFWQEKEYPNRQALNLAEIKVMQSEVDFGAHTMYHPILTRCSEDVIDGEICGAKKDLENRIGAPVVDFSYPNGDYDKRICEVVKRHGYVSGRTIDCGWVTPASNPFYLRVLGIRDDEDVRILPTKLLGITMYLSYIKQGSFFGNKPHL